MDKGVGGHPEQVEASYFHEGGVDGFGSKVFSFELNDV